MAAMTIAGLARAGGVGVETVRFYQRRGLLDEPEKGGGSAIAGGIRRYGAEHVRRLRFIRSAQGAGFTLAEILILLELDATDQRDQVYKLATARLASLDARIGELERARGALAYLTRSCAAGSSGPCPIIDAFDGRGVDATVSGEGP